MAYIFCTKCGNRLNAEAKFCNKCGAPLSPVNSAEYNTKKITCFECGRIIPINAKSCPNCGAPVMASKQTQEVSSETITCYECGHTIQAGAKSCPNCGAPVITSNQTQSPPDMITCYECGQSISANAKSCPNCGAPLAKITPPQDMPIEISSTPTLQSEPQPARQTPKPPVSESQPNTPQETAPSQTKPQTAKKRNPLPWILLMVIAVVVTGVILMLLQRGEGNIATLAKENNKTEITIEINGVAIPMKLIPGGTFTMGGSLEGIDYKDNELPAHSMKVESFYVSEYEVTQRLWTAVMGTNPSEFIGEQNPVESVSWYDCVEFTKKLSSLTGRTFRLPTEVEWEYAAKGGANQENYEFAGSNHIGDVAWAASNSGKTTHPVGQKNCNGCGLYDMSGNVYEWCSSWYAPYTVETMNNPLGPNSGEDKVFRGGSWKYSDTYCRVTYRPHTKPNGRYNNLGLRLVLEIPHKQ